MPAILWLYDIAGNQKVALNDVTNLVVEDYLQGIETLDFTIRADDAKAVYVLPDLMIRHADRYYRISTLDQTRGAAGTALIDVTAEALWLDLGKITRPGTASFLGMTNEEGLEAILSGLTWTAGTAPADANFYSMEDVDSTVLALLRRWAKVTGTEIQWDTSARTVSLVPTVGTAAGVHFRYAHNLLGIKRHYEAPAVTRLYAFGANSLEFVNVNPTGVNYIEDYSWYTGLGLTLPQARAQYRKDQIWVDERYLTPLNLYDAAIARLAQLSQPILSYECKVLDLFTLTGVGAEVGIGDTVHVYDGVFGIDVDARVVRFKHHPNDPSKDEAELAFLQHSLSDEDLQTSTRTLNYQQFALLVDENDTPEVVSGGGTAYAAIGITVTGESTVVVGSTFVGTTTGTGTVRFQFQVDGIDNLPVYDVAFVNAQLIEWSQPTWASGLDDGTHALVWTARVISGSGTIAVPAHQGKAWVMSKGAVGNAVPTSPNTFAVEDMLFAVLSVSAAATATATAVGHDETDSESISFSVHSMTDGVVVTLI